MNVQQRNSLIRTALPTNLTMILLKITKIVLILINMKCLDLATKEEIRLKCLSLNIIHLKQGPVEAEAKRGGSVVNISVLRLNDPGEEYQGRAKVLIIKAIVLTQVVDLKYTIESLFKFTSSENVRYGHMPDNRKEKIRRTGEEYQGRAKVLIIKAIVLTQVVDLKYTIESLFKFTSSENVRYGHMPDNRKEKIRRTGEEYQGRAKVLIIKAIVLTQVVDLKYTIESLFKFTSSENVRYGHMPDNRKEKIRRTGEEYQGRAKVLIIKAIVLTQVVDLKYTIESLFKFTSSENVRYGHMPDNRKEKIRRTGEEYQGRAKVLIIKAIVLTQVVDLKYTIESLFKFTSSENVRYGHMPDNRKEKIRRTGEEYQGRAKVLIIKAIVLTQVVDLKYTIESLFKFTSSENVRYGHMPDNRKEKIRRTGEEYQGRAKVLIIKAIVLTQVVDLKYTIESLFKFTSSENVRYGHMPDNRKEKIRRTGEEYQGRAKVLIIKAIVLTQVVDLKYTIESLFKFTSSENVRYGHMPDNRKEKIRRTGEEYQGRAKVLIIKAIVLTQVVDLKYTIESLFKFTSSENVRYGHMPDNRKEKIRRTGEEYQGRAKVLIIKAIVLTQVVDLKYTIESLFKFTSSENVRYGHMPDNRKEKIRRTGEEYQGRAKVLIIKAIVLTQVVDLKYTIESLFKFTSSENVRYGHMPDNRKEKIRRTGEEYQGRAKVLIIKAIVLTQVVDLKYTIESLFKFTSSENVRYGHMPDNRKEKIRRTGEEYQGRAKVLIIKAIVLTQVVDLKYTIESLFKFTSSENVRYGHMPDNRKEKIRRTGEEYQGRAKVLIIKAIVLTQVVDLKYTIESLFKFTSSENVRYGHMPDNRKEKIRRTGEEYQGRAKVLIIKAIVLTQVVDLKYTIESLFKFTSSENVRYGHMPDNRKEKIRRTGEEYQGRAKVLIIKAIVLTQVVDLKYTIESLFKFTSSENVRYGHMPDNRKEKIRRTGEEYQGRAKVLIIKAIVLTQVVDLKYTIESLFKFTSSENVRYGHMPDNRKEKIRRTGKFMLRSRTSPQQQDKR
ncbi:hypothetical protein GQR58_015716 [Nymphon striatum]|nr:hypothetical protein GQR58_015716 [Nymphon striatum]